MISIKRKTNYENKYHPKMGALCVPVTKVYKTFLGIPFAKVYEYRETYSGEIKDCKDCRLDKI